MVLRSHKWYLHGLPHLLGLTVLGIGLMVVGCGPVEPFEPPQAGEIPDGPGLFTGSKGAFVLSRDLGTNRAKTVPDNTQGIEPPAPSTTPPTPSRKTPPL
jgi:hypothetical protein